MKVEILRDKCVGSGNCVELASHMFSQDEDDGKVVLTSDEASPDDAAIMEAASCCPVGAILIDGKLL